MGGGNQTLSSSIPTAVVAPQQAPQPQRDRTRAENNSVSSNNNNFNNFNSSSAPFSAAATTTTTTTTTTTNVGGGASFEEDAEKRAAGRYPDCQQVFVGNLSPDLSEAELKAFFGTFGRVVEVRINTNTKQQSGRRLPNYGFVVFDDKQTVDTILGATKSNNLTYKSDKAEYRLNVEEKRARMGGDRGRDSGGFRGGAPKSQRATRSSSNGSRSGTQQTTANTANPANNGGGEQRPKKNFNTHTNDSNYIGDGGSSMKRKEVNYDNNNNNNSNNNASTVDGGPRDGGYRGKNNNNNANTNNYRRS